MPHDHESGHCHGHGTSRQELAADELATCRVMPGSTVVKADAEAEGLVRDYNGKRYYLCCDSCAPMWNADPTRYADAS